MKQIFCVLIILTNLLGSCKQEFVGQPGTDSVAPGKIKNPKVENISGGAKITYDLPDDDDLLYVNAVYQINGKEFNTSASIYNKEVIVKGFGSTEEQHVKLYCIDRSNNISEPVEVAIYPTTPPVQLVYESLKMHEAFGGVEVKWENKTEDDIAIYLVAADSLGDLSVADVVYTSASNGKYTLRGFDDKERMFGVFIRDHWDNYSDTLSGLFTPMYEVEVDKAKWVQTKLPGDCITANGVHNWNKMKDGLIDGSGWFAPNASSPLYFTIDLGATVKLSRYKLWHRQGAGWVYQYYNFKRWNIYGSISPKFEEFDQDYWLGGGFKEDWSHLLDCYSFKPSGEEGPVTGEDVEYATNGFEFEFPLDAPPVRYLRFHINETWGGGWGINVCEITVWGNVIEE